MDRRRTWDIADDLARAIDPETGEIVLDLDALHGELAEKAEGIHHVLVGLAGDVAGITAEQERLAKRKAAKKSSIDRLRALLLGAMQHADLEKIATATISVRRQPGKPRVVVDDVDALPDTFIEIKRVADKRAIKAAFESGATVEGAHQETGDESLVIR